MANVIGLVLCFLLCFVHIFIWYKSLYAKNRKKILWDILSDSSMALLILFFALKLYKLYDLHNGFDFIPKESMSINISVYSIILAAVLNWIKELIRINLATITIEIYKKNERNERSKDELVIDQKDIYFNAFIYVQYSGKKSKLTNRQLEIQIPYSLTAQYELNGYPDENNCLKIPLSKYLLIDGSDNYEFQINLMLKKIKSNNKKSRITASLSKSGKISGIKMDTDELLIKIQE